MSDYTTAHTVRATDLPNPTNEDIDRGLTLTHTGYFFDVTSVSLSQLRECLREARELDLHIPTITDLDARIAQQILSARAPGLDMSTWDSEQRLLTSKGSDTARVLGRIYNCGTTCCRAGHALLVAGSVALRATAQLLVEFDVGPAAAIIYYASTGYVPDFSADLDNELVLADILACAADQGWTP